MKDSSPDVRPNSRASKIPCLDGLRACAIVGVLLGHSRGTRGFPGSDWLEIFGDSGNLGVRIFFVISGFLITHLLLEEAHAAGQISLRAFYIRRTFRIFPAFYTFVLSIAILSILGVFAVTWQELALAATYTMNFVEHKPWVLAHLWSLAVEEQFYLLWPICIVALGWSRARKVAIGAIFFAPAFRSVAWYLFPNYHAIVTKGFPSICDTIAIGCFLACFRGRLSSWPKYLAFVRSPAFLIVPLIVWGSNYFAFHTRLDLLFGQTIRNIGIALSVDWCLRHPLSHIGRVLDSRIMIWIGTLSYSLYLWQQVFLNRYSNSIWCAFPLNLGLAFLFAVISYYLLERPCLRARVRLFPSSGRPRRGVLPAETAAPGNADLDQYVAPGI